MPWISKLTIPKRKINKKKPMSDNTVHVLVVDDEIKLLNAITERLKLLGFDTLKASSGDEAIKLAGRHQIGLAIVDLKMPKMDGLVTIAKLKESLPELKTVLLTGYGSEKVKQATEALNTVYFEKQEMDGLWECIKNIQRQGNVIVIHPPNGSKPYDTDEGDIKDIFRPYPIKVLPGRKPGDGTVANSEFNMRNGDVLSSGRFRIIGETLCIQNLKRNLKRFAALDCAMILYGETGVGKELAARTIHELSHRRKQRFMAINCGCFSNDLLVEEFFGGATGDIPKKNQPPIRFFGADSGGTILLDQIEDLTPKMQLSMLKIIDHNRGFQLERPHTDPDPFGLRILASGRNDLGKLVREGKFREELYFRLNVVELQIPPLRERRDDIPPLCSYFLDRFAREFDKTVKSISDEVLALFMAYDFPGNIRELEHVIERAVILAEDQTLEPCHLPERFQNTSHSTLQKKNKIITLAEKEMQYILEVLETAGGNKSKTAKLLGISRAALWRKLKQFHEEGR
jgi:two-component system response regulator AtoC